MLTAATRPTEASFGPVPPEPPEVPPPLPPGPGKFQRPPVPPVTGRAFALVVLTAAMTDIAIQGRVASLAGWSAVVAAATLVLAAPARRSWSAVIAAGTAIALGSNLVLRASDWVIGPTVLACVGLLLLAALDRLTTVRLRGMANDVARLGRGLIESPDHLTKPARTWLERGPTERVVLVRGAAVALGVVSLLTLLLANADAVVGELIDQTFGSSMWSHVALSLMLTVPVGAVAVVANASPLPVSQPWISTARPVEALMGLSATALVLTSWVGVQVAIALGGADRILADASMTRAEYAREGFFELVLVVAVVLSLTALLGGLLGRQRPPVATGLVVLVGTLTVVLVGVTFSRLDLYIEAYGLTMLRLAVAWFLGWLAVIVVAVTARIAGVGGRRAWLVPFAIITAALAIGVFGWSNPEATVAATNLSRDGEIVQLDEGYLEDLGPDAAATLRTAGLIDPNLCLESADTRGLLNWNRSWSLAC